MERKTSGMFQYALSCSFPLYLMKVFFMYVYKGINVYIGASKINVKITSSVGTHVKQHLHVQ